MSFTFYHKVFITDFPKLSFRKPNTDTCKKRERLHNDKKSCDKTLAETAKRSLEIHQRKAEHAYNDLKHDVIKQESDTTTLVWPQKSLFFT